MAGEDGEQAGRPRPLGQGGLLARVANPLAWTLTDRCVAVALFLLLAVALFVALVNLGAGWPSFAPNADREGKRLIASLSIWFVVPWLVLLGAALPLRKRAPQSRVLVHVTVQLYSLTIAVFTVITGPSYSPGWIAFLGGAVVGFLLFDRLPTWLGVAMYFVVVAGSALAAKQGVLPRMLLVGLPPEQRVPVGWSIGLGAASVSFSLLVLALASHIITRWRDREAGFERMSMTDSLTGLTNRRHLMVLFESELGRARRYQTALSCVIVDLDHFKQVNDQHGHLAGDRVLQSVARTLAASLRDVDVCARYGGEEFVLLLPATSQTGAEEVAQRCLKRISETPIEIGDGRKLDVTASFGVASFPHPDVKRVEDLLRLSDEALYRAKSAGRARVAS